MKILEKYEATITKGAGWTLTEEYLGRGQDGNNKIQTRTTHHTTLKDCLNKIIDIEARREATLESFAMALTGRLRPVVELRDKL